MKITIATHHFPPRYVGGVELITLRLARWLVCQGNDVEIICVESISGEEKDSVLTRREQFENLTVNRLTISHRQDLGSFRESYDNPVIGQWFENYLHQTQPDIVHIHSGYLLSSSTIPATRRVGLPLVVSLHDYWFICPQIKLIRPDGKLCSGSPSAAECAWCLMMRQRRYRLLEALSLGQTSSLVRCLAGRDGLVRHRWEQLPELCEERQHLVLERLGTADVVTTQSPFLRARVISLGLSPDKIRLIPYGLDLSGWQSVIRATRSDGTLRIGYLGQIAPPKGVHLLIKAFEKLRSPTQRLSLTIHGDVEQHASYGRRLKRLVRANSQITFAGRYDSAQLPGILAGLDVVVVPSQWYEIGPLVTLEALAAKTPVVATNLPNMNAQVTHGVNGLLFEPGDANDLSRQLQRLIDEPALLDHLRAGIGPVRTREQEAEGIFRTYQELLGV